MRSVHCTVCAFLVLSFSILWAPASRSQAFVVAPQYDVAWTSFIHRPILDTNGNGTLDIIGFTRQDALVRVVFDPTSAAGAGTGGTWPPSTTLFTGNPALGNINHIYAEDLTGDGVRDLVVIQQSVSPVTLVTRTTTVLPITAAGTQPSLTLYASTPAALHIPAFGDFDGDGLREMATVELIGPTTATTADITLRRIAGGVPLAIPQGLPGLIGGEMFAGDVDGDGYDDLVQESPNNFFNGSPPNGIVFLWRGSPTGLVGPRIDTPTFAGIVDIEAVTDIDSDGRADVIIQRLDSTRLVYVLWGTANPTAPFSAPQLIAMPAVPALGVSMEDVEIDADDMDNDGLIDLVVTRYDHSGSPQFYGPSEIFILRGFGGRQFSAAAIPVLVYGSQQVAGTSPAFTPLTQLSDLDQDGDVDVICDCACLPTIQQVATILVAANNSLSGNGCAGSFGIPIILHSPAIMPSPAFTIDLTQARPLSPAVLGCSTAVNPSAIPCSVGIDISPSKLLLPGGVFVTSTNSFGTATFARPLPLTPSLSGFTFWAQWAVIDPSGGATFGITPLALTPLSAITLL